MKKLSARISKLSYLAAYFFSAVLFVSANSASSFIIYQETPPESLRLFSKIRR
ncbi:MAG: cyclic lactone autoinducer peptide [Acutalibacter sp.]